MTRSSYITNYSWKAVQLPRTTSDLREAYSALADFRRNKYNTTISPYDFSDSLKELEGTFTKTWISNDQLIIDFHNPSINDYLESHLKEVPEEIEDICQSIVFPTQIKTVLGLIQKTQSSISDKLKSLLVQKFFVVAFSKNIELIRYSRRHSGTYWDYFPSPIEKQLGIFFDVVDSKPDAEHFASFSTILNRYIKESNINAKALGSFLSKLLNFQSDFIEEIQEFCKWGKSKLIEFAKGTDSTEEFGAIVNLHEEHNVLSSAELETIKSEFIRIYQTEFERIENDNPPLNEVEDILSDFQYIGEIFSIDLSDDISQAKEHTKEVEYPEDDGGWYDHDREERLESKAEIKSLFETLYIEK